MRNLPVPALDALSYYEKVATEKKGKISQRLIRIQKQVGKAYIAYELKVHALETLVPIGLAGVREKALLHAYGVRTQSMKKMRKLLLSPVIEDFDECPYCGINEPKTLDHYLPKEQFPEFSIFPNNLVPICGVCNTNYKRMKFLSVAGIRQFLHSYYDQFPAFTFISTRVVVNGKILIEFVNHTDPGNPSFSSIFANHFSELELNTRFNRKSAAEINRKRASLRRMYSAGGHQQVSRELKQEANDLRTTLSSNHWKVALYDALAGSVDFCDGGFAKEVALV